MGYEYSDSLAPQMAEAKSYPHESQPGTGNNDGRLRVKSASSDATLLAQPITFPFSGRTAKNRFLKAPMTERLCGWNDEDKTLRGYPTEAYEHLYKTWGEGEIGIIVSGNVMVMHDALEAYGNPILEHDRDGRVEGFKKVTAAAKAHGSLIIAQLSHPGRQGPKTLNPNPVSASDVHLTIKHAGNEFAKPRTLTVPEIKKLVKQWGETAYLCYKAGWDGVQVHCAHGYLIAQFLASTTNKRTDEYGGTFENRTRLIFEIIAEIKSRINDPTFIICVKINSVEFQPGGQTPEDCRDLCIALEKAKVDFIDISGGTFEGRAFQHKKESTAKRESYFIEFAEMMRPLITTTKLYVTGGFRTTSGMANALSSNACDGIGIGRPLGAEPFLCREILQGKVSGAIENFMPLPKQTQATGTQLHQIGGGDRLVSDWSDEGEVERWLEADKIEEARKISVLPKVDSSGYAEGFKAEVGFEYVR